MKQAIPEKTSIQFDASHIGALAHLFRAEVYRSTIWRVRFDNTTNWAVVSTGIADIFRNNSLKNGLLPVIVEEATSGWLLANPGAELTVDLAAGTLTLPTGLEVSFPIEAFARHCLLNGVDELGYLLSRSREMEAYERRA